MPLLTHETPRWDAPGLRVDERFARVPRWAALAAFFAAAFLLAGTGRLLTVSPGSPAIVWPLSGLFVLALLVSRAKTWPLVLATGAAAALGGAVASGHPVGPSLALALGRAAESAAAVWLIRAATPRVTTQTIRGVVALLMGPALVRVVAASLWRVAAVARGEPFFDPLGGVYALGALLGVATLGWLLVAWTEAAPPQDRPFNALAETVLAVVTMAGAVALIHLRGELFSNEILLVPPVIWLAVRFGPRGASAAVCLAALALAHTASVGHGLIPLGASSPVSLTFGVQFFLLVLTAPTAFVAAVVSERQAAEERRLLLARAMDQSADGLGIFEEDGRIAWANAAASRFYGAPPRGLVGRRAWEFFPDGTLEKWRRNWDRFSAAGVVVTEQRTRGADGRVTPWEVSVALVRASGQRVAVAAMRDVTDRQRAAEALRLAGIGTLAAGVAHEINNPLASVVGNLALLRERMASIRERGGPPELIRFVDEWHEPIVDAEDGARRVREVVAELRVFARAEAGRGPVDMARAMRSALSLAQSEIQHRARLVTRIGDVPTVHGSEGRLAQAFANILVNAARAIPEGASQENEIRVEVRARGDEVVAEIADSGIGMSREVREHMFEPFFTTRDIGEGSGLGLAVTHAIVTAMGGRIDVDSAPGAGTRIRIVLPADKEAQRAPAHTPAPPRPAAAPPVVDAVAPSPSPSAPRHVPTPTPGVAPAAAATARLTPASPPLPPLPPPIVEPAVGVRSRLKLLVVDDEPLVGRSLQRILSREHDVEITDRARGALDRIAGGERFDAVLCDLMMPDVSGMAFYDEVAILDPDLQGRIVFVTGGAFTEAARDFLDRVQNLRLEKPVDPTTLRETVRAFTPRPTR
jgi:PAS domain S-box-containing protein